MGQINSANNSGTSLKTANKVDVAICSLFDAFNEENSLAGFPFDMCFDHSSLDLLLAIRPLALSINLMMNMIIGMVEYTQEGCQCETIQDNLNLVTLVMLAGAQGINVELLNQSAPASQRRQICL